MPAGEIALATLSGHMGVERLDDLGVLLQLLQILPIPNRKARQIRAPIAVVSTDSHCSTGILSRSD